MSAPTLDNFIDSATTSRVRAARVSFCDREDAEMFLEWLRVRSEALATAVTFPLFVCTAADAYSLSSATTYAVFGDTPVDDLSPAVAESIATCELPAVLGPFDAAAGWDVVFALSRR